MIRWKLRRIPATSTEKWAADSPKLKKRLLLQRSLHLAGLVVFVVALVLHHPYHRGQINWTMAVSAPGYLLIFWAQLVGIYVAPHLSDPPAANHSQPDPMQELHSDHWGHQLPS
jgi:hypothetical protein